jgi:hypothetical protein
VRKTRSPPAIDTVPQATSPHAHVLKAYWRAAADVGGYGCGESRLPTDPYMQQLIVRWYQFGAFSPVFRTHGCRSGPSEPNTKQCSPAQNSCGEFYPQQRHKLCASLGSRRPRAQQNT